MLAGHVVLLRYRQLYGSAGARSSDSDAAGALDEPLDRVGEVHRVDVVVAALDAEPVRLEQHLGVREAVRRLEAVRGQLDQQPERVLEVDRVHEAAILDAAVADAALVEPLDDLRERRLGEREGDVVDVAGLRRRRASGRRRAPRS